MPKILKLFFTFILFYFIQSLNANNVNSEPSDNAPTPPARKTTDVISIFSDAYNNIEGANYNPDWNQSGFESASSTYQPSGSGNSVLAYLNFNYQGIEFNSVQDISSMEFLHIDVWTLEGLTPTVSVISSGTATPKSIPNGDGKWKSIDIPVSDITGDLTKTIQLMFSGGNGSSDVIYLDNLYFYKRETALEKDATLNALEVDDISLLGFTPNKSTYEVELLGGTTVVPQVTLATTTNASASRVITQATIIPGDATVVVTSEDGSTENTYTISYYIGAPNINAPTPPTREALDVISIFSDSYNNISGANYNPDWQQTGFSSANAGFQPEGSGNSVLAYPNFNYQGIEFNSTQDISAMEFLHLDIWTVKGISPTVSVISSGSAIPKSIPNGDGKWQSIDIPVANITGDLTKTIQLMFNGGNGSSTEIYVDNIYFYKAPTVVGEDATLSALKVDGNTVSGFTPNSKNYLIELPGGTSVVPQITLATTADESATRVITQATTIPGDATVKVTAQNGTTTKTYKLSFFIGAPNVNAPTPPARNAVDVISIFSDSYNNISGANYNPDWQQTGFSSANAGFQPEGPGNSVLAYPNFNYQGIEFNSAQDISAMEFLHLDIWTVKGISPTISVISSGSAIPKSMSNGDGKWQSIDIPVANITGDLTRTIQLMFNGGSGSPSAIYVDNLYFYKSPAVSGKDATLSDLKVDGNSVSGFTPNSESYLMALLGGTTIVPQITLATAADASASTVITQATSIPGIGKVEVTSQDGSTTKTYDISFYIGEPNTNAPTPPSRESSDVISIFSDTYNNISGANYNPNWQQSGFGSANIEFKPTASANSVLAYTNFSYQGIELNSDLDLTSMEYLHLDVWTVNGLNPSIIVISSGSEISHRIGNNDGEWKSMDIPVTGITGDITKATQIKFIGGNGYSNDIYIDNLYFWKAAPLGVTNFDDLKFSAYPNPTNDNWVIKTQKTNISSIKVFDIQGKKVISILPNSDEFVIDGSSLKSGLYFARIKTDSGSKLIKLIKK
jgi:hypothetical protein